MINKTRSSLRSTCLNCLINSYWSYSPLSTIVTIFRSPGLKGQVKFSNNLASVVLCRSSSSMARRPLFSIVHRRPLAVTKIFSSETTAWAKFNHTIGVSRLKIYPMTAPSNQNGCHP